jgi:hypothetical protein
VSDDLRTQLTEKVGGLIATKIVEANEVQLARLIVEA